MFYYFGGKAQTAHLYPPPAHPVIVEPFAGAAGYAMFHLSRVERVVLIEKDERVAALWRRLLAMTPEDVMALPVPAVGSRSTDPLVFMTAASNAAASCSYMTVTPRMAQRFEMQQRKIAKRLRYRDRIEICVGSYESAPDDEATWFIDPPYLSNGSNRGDGYGPGCRARDLDFAALGQWVNTRQGQVIVCEAGDATWLPITPTHTRNDTVGTSRVEGFWTNEPATLFG